jgi:hypothetical protein
VKDNNGSTIGARLKGWLGDCEELVRVRPGFIVAFAEDEIRASTAKLEAENAELRRQLEEPRGSRCYDCGGAGCESCELTGDAGTQVLRLKNRAHDLEVQLEEARGKHTEMATAITDIPKWFGFRPENWRECCASISAKLKQDAKQIVDQMREISAARGEAQRTVYVVAQDEDEANERALNGCGKSRPVGPDLHIPGDYVYAVTLAARKVGT